MNTKLFIGGLPWETSDDDLMDLFEEYGPVKEAKVIMDRETGRSRGFGFVTYESASDAKEAIENMDGHSVGRRNIRVNEATEKPRKSGGGGGFGRDRDESPRGGYDDRRSGRGSRRSGGPEY